MKKIFFLFCNSMTFLNLYFAQTSLNFQNQPNASCQQSFDLNPYLSDAHATVINETNVSGVNYPNGLWFSFTGDGQTYVASINKETYMGGKYLYVAKGDCTNLTAVSVVPIPSASCHTCAPSAIFVTEPDVKYYIQYTASFGLPSEFNLTISNSTLGISEPHNNTVDIFPNPASESITILDKNIREVTFYNTEGKILFKVIRKYKDIDISMLPKGVYFAQIVLSDGSTQIRKFLKN
ncbi:T9SS C-terminal target domain-containing protein [Chryseobacterium taklimakanense]|uniref:T9SS type A sorting domain-containing protein n=1 Tax=Chryseobacterium taklimakanense TaxID=536441 RepID=UPI000F5FFFA7|nr:T9SS type A sorting domain-containing protein [Chryseobacterium taklimakanense]AZI23396.1 T9SS C-terminal target domain-containing protein [Chryseobacterium taklimakanense]